MDFCSIDDQGQGRQGCKKKEMNVKKTNSDKAEQEDTD